MAENSEEKWMLEAYDKARPLVEKREKSEEVNVRDFTQSLNEEAKENE